MATFKAFPVINMSATGANIQKLRKSSGYTVADLQNYFGFDAPQAIYKWQRGETLPSTDNLLALGYLFEVPIEKILIFQTIGNNDAPQDDSCGDHLFLSDFFWIIFNYYLQYRSFTTASFPHLGHFAVHLR